MRIDDDEPDFGRRGVQDSHATLDDLRVHSRSELAQQIFLLRGTLKLHTARRNEQGNQYER